MKNLDCAALRFQVISKKEKGTGGAKEPTSKAMAGVQEPPNAPVRIEAPEGDNRLTDPVSSDPSGIETPEDKSLFGRPLFFSLGVLATILILVIIHHVGRTLFVLLYETMQV